MDSITHIALGACIGEAFFGKKLGKKALLLGALANSIPDLDFVAGLWMSPASNLLAHRGFTHSLLFALMVSILLAFLFERWQRIHRIPIRGWILFFAVEIFSHLFLDAFNAYGVGWFEPFNHYRVSWNTVFVADPFFSIWVGISLMALLVLKKADANRIKWAKFGILFSSLYLCYCVINKSIMDNRVKKIFALEHIDYKRYFISPTPLNNWLWYIVAESDSGYRIGYSSLFDNHFQVNFQYFPRNAAMLTDLSKHEDLRQLLRFSKGYYTIESWNDTLVFNDLRFGQMNGWQNPRGRFTFHYFLLDPGSNRLVLQRGRFQLWNKYMLKSLVERIEGKRVLDEP